jgi:hypothetical protein
MAERVVDVLEAIEIHEQHGDRSALAARGQERLGGAVAEKGAVGQPGEGVVQRLMAVFGRLLAQPPRGAGDDPEQGRPQQAQTAEQQHEGVARLRLDPGRHGPVGHVDLKRAGRPGVAREAQRDVHLDELARLAVARLLGPVQARHLGGHLALQRLGELVGCAKRAPDERGVGSYRAAPTGARRRRSAARDGCRSSSSRCRRGPHRLDVRQGERLHGERAECMPRSWKTMGRPWRVAGRARPTRESRRSACVPCRGETARCARVRRRGRRAACRDHGG